MSDYEDFSNTTLHSSQARYIPIKAAYDALRHENHAEGGLLATLIKLYNAGKSDSLAEAAKNTQEMAEQDNTVTEPQIRYFVAYGLQGYGPDGSDNNYEPCTTWTDLAYTIENRLAESSEQEYETYRHMFEMADETDDLGLFKEAYTIMRRSDELSHLASSFSNDRASAPLYQNDNNSPDPDKWDAEVKRLVDEHFGHRVDVSHNTALYVWKCEDDETWADYIEED